MNESFPATIKLITGEEILAEVSLMEENETDFFLVNDAIVISETMQIDHQKGIAMSGLVPKKWQLYANDSMTIINKQHIISISELDKFGEEFYNKALIAARLSSPIKRKVVTSDNVGYVGNIKDSRKYLERLYNKSANTTEE
jgi:hypothetical protein